MCETEKGNKMKNEVYTPYQAAKRINADSLTVKTVAPQQLYGDVRKNKVPSTRNNVGTLTVTWSDVLVWVEAFNGKQAAKAAKKASVTITEEA